MNTNFLLGFLLGQRTRAAVLMGVTALGAIVGVHDAQAQSATSGAMSGVVNDSTSGEPMAGVTVVATSPALQGTQTAATEANGSYKITNLPPGIYNVTFYFAELTVERQNITITVNRVTPVHVKLDTSKAAGEKIIIKKQAPTIDTTSTAQGVTLDRDYTKFIPVPGRDFESALGAAAGSQGDAMGVSFSGSTSLENQYVVDGVNTTGLTYGTVGSPVINEFIKEIEIITGGYQAEYGRATGGVVNVVTESGTNEFHGTVFTTFANDFLAIDPERTPLQNSIDVRSNTLYDMTVGATLGGPIIKDKLWFFVGFAPRVISVDTLRITKRLTDCRIIEEGELSPCLPDEAGYQNGEPDEDENGFYIYEDIPGGSRTLNSAGWEMQFVSKLNYALSPEQQGQLTFSGTPSSTEIVGAFGLPSATNYKTSSLGTDLAAKWTSKFNNNKTEIEAVTGWHRSNFKVESDEAGAMDTPNQTLVFGNLGTWSRLGGESDATEEACDDDSDMDPYTFIDNCPDLGYGYSVGGLGGVTDDTEQRIAAKLGAIQRVKAVGDHEIKVGFDVEQNLLNKPRAITGNRAYTHYIGNDLSPAGYRDRIEEARWVKVAAPGETDAAYDQTCGLDDNDDPIRCQFIGPTDVEGNTLNWSAYLRDSWQIIPNLTLNAGVRYEEQRMRYAKFIQGEVDPFTGQRRGTNAMSMTGMWAPRIGLIYDWTKEGRSKVYTSYGRFYESIPLDINDRSFGGETFLTRRWDSSEQCGANVDGFGSPSGEVCGTQENETDPAFGNELLGGGTLVAPGIKPQFMEELAVGVDYEVLEDLRLGLAYQYRWMGRVLEDVSTDNADTYIIANPGEWSSSEETKLEEQIMAEDDPAIRSILEANLEKFRGIRQFDKPRRDYHSLQFTATKRMSNNFMVQGSYTYSRTIGNYPGLFSPDNGQVDPNITSQYDLIELLSNRDGPLPHDRPHYLKMDGYYRFDFKRAGELIAGARVRALSGVPINALGAHYLYGQRESFLLPRGDMGRTPWRSTLDLRVVYGREMGRGMKLEVFGDLFNVFNLQETASVDQAYSYDFVNPVVGGTYEDLIWAKAQTNNGGEDSLPVSRNKNFNQTVGRGVPLYLQLGARLTF